MKEIDQATPGCHLCRLAGGRTNAVPGSGLVENVEVVFVGRRARKKRRSGRKTIRRGSAENCWTSPFATPDWTEIEST